VSGRPWREGDTVGCLLQVEKPSPTATFYLNGQIVAFNDKIFQYAKYEDKSLHYMYLKIHFKHV